MLNCEAFYNLLKDRGVEFFSGVPDSLLKDICAYITKNSRDGEHIIAANEGNSIALGAGHYLASGKTPLIYLQNSGLGNIVNPLLSLADKDVYSIPMIIMIGWRGEPHIKDEPQHVKQGKVTLPMLESMGIKYKIIENDFVEASRQINTLLDHAKEYSEPVVMIVRKGTFESYEYENDIVENTDLEREEAIELVANSVSQDSLILSTTGKISRELYEYRVQKEEVECNDFLNVGAMGHVSQLALGVALVKPEKKVVCFDGDGAFLMHMGGASIVATQAPKNYLHFVFNNAAHDSVGGQPTVAQNISIKDIALACGYKSSITLNNRKELEEVRDSFKNMEGPALIEILVKKGSRSDLGRPKSTPIENKKVFIEKVRK
jgi:phosphonopyruvate decarboxylase